MVAMPDRSTEDGATEAVEAMELVIHLPMKRRSGPSPSQSTMGPHIPDPVMASSGSSASCVGLTRTLAQTKAHRPSLSLQAW